jgi:hypothetical protein
MYIPMTNEDMQIWRRLAARNVPPAIGPWRPMVENERVDLAIIANAQTDIAKRLRPALAIPLILAMLCTGCADLTANQRLALKIGISVAATGAIIAYQNDHGGGGEGSPQSKKTGCTFSTSYCAGDTVGK